MAISVKALRKAFSQKGHAPLLVLDGVNFDVACGEFVTLMGPSGCGKTTILKIIAGIERADSGEIILCGGNANDGIPIIWQEHRLFPWKTVIDNVAFPLELRDLGPADTYERAREALQIVDLEQFAHYYPWQLSGGMAQRVAIARALVISPSMILMDEPFASIDYQSKLALWEQVRVIRSQKVITIVYVTHDLRDAIRWSDRIIVLSRRPSSVREIIQPDGADLQHSLLEERLEFLLSIP